MHKPKKQLTQPVRGLVASMQLLGTGVDITIAMPAFTDTAMRTVGLQNDRSVRPAPLQQPVLQFLTALSSQA